MNDENLNDDANLNSEQGEAAQEIVNAILAGQKILAIKHYRAMTHCDLLTAKNRIEAMEFELRRTVPEQFKPASSGCATVILFAMSMGLSAMVLLLLQQPA